MLRGLSVGIKPVSPSTLLYKRRALLDLSYQKREAFAVSRSVSHRVRVWARVRGRVRVRVRVSVSVRFRVRLGLG